MKKLKTIIVDDHRLFRDLLKRVLIRYPSIEVVAEADTAEESLRQVFDLRPDLVTVDINLPGMNGFDLVRALKSRFPNTCEIIISVNGNPAFQREAESLRCPYIPKESLMEDLPRVMEVVIGEIAERASSGTSVPEVKA